MHVKIYTDGSCLNNPGPGGWAALIEPEPKGKTKAEKPLTLSGGEPHTTNNRMELTAVIEALKALRIEKPETQKIEVYSDSSWVINTLTQNWKRKKNLDLWEQLIPLIQGYDISWHWVKGHAGHPQNEQCDALAQKEAKHFAKVARTLDPTKLTLPGDPPGLF